MLLELGRVVAARVATRPLAQSWPEQVLLSAHICWGREVLLTVAVEGVGVRFRGQTPVLVLLQSVVIIGGGGAILHLLLLPLPPSVLFCCLLLLATVENAA